MSFCGTEGGLLLWHYLVVVPELLAFILLRSSGHLFVEGRITSVEILGVKIVLRYSYTVAEALVVNELSFSEEFDRISDVGVVCQAQNIVVSGASLLLCCYRSRATK